MPYVALPGLAMPYHLDGSVVKMMNSSSGVVKTFSTADLLELNDTDYLPVTVGYNPSFCVVFFPELRDIHAIFAVNQDEMGGQYPISSLKGSVDSTNGLDGTWTDATVVAYPPNVIDLDSWRKSFKTVSALDGVKAIRFYCPSVHVWTALYALHIYGHKTAGQTVDDILFLDADSGDAEFTTSPDFGDHPAGVSVLKQIKLKNASLTKAANNVVLTVIDPVDQIRIGDSSAGPWVTTKTIISLAANTKSDVIYVKCETPAPPTPLGPMRAPIKVVVGSWT